MSKLVNPITEIVDPSREKIMTNSTCRSAACNERHGCRRHPRSFMVSVCNGLFSGFAVFCALVAHDMVASAQDEPPTNAVAAPLDGVAPSPKGSASAASTATTSSTAAQEDTQVNSEVASEEEFDDSLETVDNGVRTLSVQPGSQPLLPADRPAWVGAPADYTGKTHRMFIGSLPTPDEERADLSLNEPLVATVNEYIDSEVIGVRGAAEKIAINAEYIRKNLVTDNDGYLLELNTSSGAMYQKWVSLEVTPEQRAQLESWHNEAIQRERLKTLGAGLAAILALVGLSHLTLRSRHGSPKLKPLTTQAMISSEEPVANRGRGFGLSALAVLACVVVLPGLLLAALLVPYVGFRAKQHSSSQLSELQSFEHEISERLGRVQRMPDMPPMPEMPSMPDMSEMPEMSAMPDMSSLDHLPSSSAEVIIESNGQKIKITRQRD